jgi:outer membrane protein insertion porin family
MSGARRLEVRRRTPRALRGAHALLALALLGGCAVNGGGGGPLPQFSQYEGREVRSVEFEGELVVPEDSLRAVVTTRPTRCRILGFLPICPFGIGRDRYMLDLGVLQRDVARLQLAHRDAGYYGSRVLPQVDPAADTERVDVRFLVEPGDLVTLTSFGVRGVEEILDTARLHRRMPLRVGEPFRRVDFLASVDTLRNALLDEGYAYAQVFRNFGIDTDAGVADVVLDAAPGPLVTVDSVLFYGQYRLHENTLRRQMALREGSLLRATELNRSQRNLFDLELVRFAAVQVAPERLQLVPDSLQLDEDSIGSTILVRIEEAPRYAVDLAAMYGTRDCFRGELEHVDRNFLGGARRLQLSGLVAKLGVGDPVGGLAETLCPAFRLDDRFTPVDSLIARQLNWRVAANFLQPRLFGTQTRVAVGAFTERISELDLYVRDATGGDVAVIRQIAPQTLGSLTFTAQRGRTQASDYFFCIAYEVCDRQDIQLLELSRWSNAVVLSVAQNRTRMDPFPSGGHQARASVDHASALLGSDDEFLRLAGDALLHRQLRRRTVLSLGLGGGIFLNELIRAEGGYVPPERRFYGGGPTGVRGFRFNELGPTVYIARPRRVSGGGFEVDTVRSATGGTRAVLATAEVTFPLPIGPEALRAAVFVDAGQVWNARDTLALNAPIRATPGVGLRFASPVGPFRLDLAYNPYPATPGPLYGINERGELLPQPILPRFTPGEERSFLRRLVVQVSVGNTL